MSFSRKPAAVAVCLALAAGGGGAAVLASSAGADQVTTTTTTGATTSVATGTGTVSITGPAGKTHTRSGAVSCRLVDGRYVVRAGRRVGVKRVAARRVAAQRAGAKSSATRAVKRGTGLRLAVRHYTGPGAYTATAVIVRRSPSGFSRHHYKVPVTLTSTGGSVNVTKTLSGKRHPALKGKTVKVTASWTCSV